MLKSACMQLGPRVCHELISTLNVGDTLIVATLGMIAVCETLLIWFLVHAWQTRERRQAALAFQPRPHPRPPLAVAIPNLDPSAS